MSDEDVVEVICRICIGVLLISIVGAVVSLIMRIGG